MWTFDNPPLADLKTRYGFEPSPQWLEHARLAAVHVGGASGAFVSPEGLVLTNHHVALGSLQKLSTPQNDYVQNGFFARERSQEMRCHDIELSVLVSMQEVTQRVMGAVDGKSAVAEQNRQRKAEIARIEKEASDQTKLRCTVVSLYGGGEYWLYSYKRYTDVRLVMAPEFQAAFYGGDPDNFTFPRYDLDFAFFRVYENDQPARTEHYFKFNPAGPKENDLVFVVGHPGSTQRLHTVAQLEYERDHRLPLTLQMSQASRKALYEYAARGAEQARQVKDRIFGVENGIKARTGYYEGLKDPTVFDRLRVAEASLREEVSRRGDLSEVAGSWDRIAGAVAEAATRQKQSAYYSLSGSRLADIALTLLRRADELEKPNDTRYEEFRDSSLPSLDLKLFSKAPIYPELEEHLLGAQLTRAREALGDADPFVVAVLAGRDPKAVAHDVISGTKLADPEYRKTLATGGRAAIAQCNDPLIVLARKLDPLLRQQRDWHDTRIQSVEAAEGRKIARARFAVLGRNTYPDATGTLRLAFGRIAGYELNTTLVPWKTTFYDLFGRSASFDNRPPFDLAPAIAAARDKLDLATPLDFVSTNDIIGGNSGSPVINRDGQYVGLIFDGNIQSLVLDFAYTDTAARAISVHSAAILEALKKIYPMPKLVEELTR